MNKKWIITFVSVTVIIGFSAIDGVLADGKDRQVRNGTIPLSHEPEADFPGLAGITLQQAVDAAQKSSEGKVLKVELEDENGFLVYGVETVDADGQIMDIKVDAGSGDILLVEHDLPDSENDGDREEGDKEDEDRDN